MSARSHTVIRSLGLFLVIPFFVAGCAITYHVRKDALPAPSTAAMVQQWPLTVGVVVPPAVKSRVFAKYAARVPAGEAAASTFHWALEQMFTEIVDLDGSPSAGTVPSGLAGVIELSDISFTFPDISDTYLMPGALHYEIGLYSRQGESIARWSLTTPGLNWDLEESSLSSLIQSVGTTIAYGIRDVTAQFMVSFSRSPEVQSWLASEGVTTSGAGPVFGGQGTVTEHAPTALLLSNLNTWLYTDASRAMNCVGHRLGQSTPPVTVIPIDAVRLAFFPWLEMSTAPKTLEGLRNWLSEPAVRQKARAIGARYLVELHGGTRTEWSGGIACGGGYGGGGCLGLAWGDRMSAFSALVLDMWGGDAVSETSATQRGDVFVPALILPIPIIAPTEGKACDELAAKIHGILTQRGKGTQRRNEVSP